MGFTVDQLDFLEVHIRVAVPPEFKENKRRAETFKSRSAGIGARSEELKQRRDAAKLGGLLEEAGAAAEKKDFIAALKLLDEVETGLAAPDLPPAPEPPAPTPPEVPAPAESTLPPPSDLPLPPPPVAAEDDKPLPIPADLPPLPSLDETVGVGKTMQRRMEAADQDFVLRKRMAEIEPLYQAAIKGKSPALKKLKEYYAAAKKAAANSKWSEAADYLGRIEGLLKGVEAEKQQVETQKAQAKRLGDTMGKVKSITFPVGAADQFKKEKLKPGKEFEKFLTALKKFEKDKTRDNLEAMEKAAHAYLDHLAELPEKEQAKSDRPRKKEICLTQLKAATHWKLADDYESLGDPPWDFEQENKAGGIYSRMLFEESDKPGERLKNDEGGVSAAWWVEETSSFDYDKGTDSVSQTQTRKLIFKPMDGESTELPGYKPGMSAPREVVAKVLNDQIREMTGVDPGVCPTFLVPMNNDRLSGPDNKPEPNQPNERVGSVQQLAANDGSLGKRKKESNDPNFAQRIPKKNFDDMIMLDMMSLNLDRHGKNFLLKDNPDGTSNLIPIDHGYCFPTAESIKLNRSRLGPPQNVLMELPQANEPFSPEALQAIDMLDPDAIAETMKAAAKSMGETTPEAKGMVSDESIEISRRSGLLLKRGARELTPAELNAALRIHLDELLDAPANKLNQTIDAIIQAAKKRHADREDCKNLIAFPADPATYELYASNLTALGWDLDNMDRNKLPVMFAQQPDRIAKILRGRILHPEAKKKIDVRLKLLGNAVPLPSGFDTLPVKERIDWLDSELRKLKKTVPPEAEGERPGDISGPAAKKLLAKYPEKRLKELASCFRDFEPNKSENPDPKAETERLAEALAWYELFEKEGGLEEAGRLTVALGSWVAEAVSDVRAAKKLEAALKTTDKISVDDSRQQQTAFVTQLVNDFDTGLKKLLDPNLKKDLSGKLAAAQSALTSGDTDMTQKILEPQARRLQAKLAEESKAVAAGRARWLEFEAALKQALNNPALPQYQQKFAAELKGIEPLLARGAFEEASKVTKLLSNELDRVLQGGNSRISRLEKLHAEVLDMVKNIPEAASAIQYAQDHKDNGDLDQYWGQITQMQDMAAQRKLAPLRKDLEPKKVSNRDGHAAFSKKWGKYLTVGLSTRLAKEEVKLPDLLSDLPVMIKEIAAL